VERDKPGGAVGFGEERCCLAASLHAGGERQGAEPAAAKASCSASGNGGGLERLLKRLGHMRSVGRTIVI
jgi:hypothetical protein